MSSLRRRRGARRSTYELSADGRPQSAHTTVELQCPWETPRTFAYGSAFGWRPHGGAVDLQASDDLGAWQQTLTVAVAAGETGRDYTPEGNLKTVHFDEDGDGDGDVVHTYRYEGEGPCREGTNPQLTPRIPDLAGLLLPTACRFSPKTQALADAYGLQLGAAGWTCP